LRRAVEHGQALPSGVSAWAGENGVGLGPRNVADNSKALPAVPDLVRAVELRGGLGTPDAMGCQNKSAKHLIDSGADAVLALKGNHATVHAEGQTYLDDAIRQQAADRSARRRRTTAELVALETVEKDHGRRAARRDWQSDKIGWFADRPKWAGLRSVGVVEAVREIKGHPSTERRYSLSSLACDVPRFAKAVRGHWGVETQGHWHRDVSFGEDHSRARTGHAAEHLAPVRRVARTLLTRETTKKRGIRGKQRCAGWDHRYLLHLLSIAPS
jgi:predicted transposase YbfD/YdcC